MKKEHINIVLIGILILSCLLILIDLIDYRNPIISTGNIEDDFFVLTVAIDKAKDKNENYRITVVTEKFGQSSSKTDSQGKEQAINIAEGKTIFDTISNFVKTKDKKIFWGQLKQILISEDVCKDDVTKILDYFVRDHEVRFDIDILITKGSAESIIELGDAINEFIPDVIDGLIKNMFKKSITKKTSLRDYSVNFDNEKNDNCIPFIQVKEYDTADGKKKKVLEVDGYAIFSSKKLIGYIENDVAEGVNYINDDIQNSSIYCQTSSKEYISAEVVKSVTEKEIKYTDGKIEVKITTNTYVNLAEAQVSKKILNEDELLFIQNGLQEKIKDKINQAIKYSKEKSVDIFKINIGLSKKYPKEWEKIKKDYKEKIKDIEYSVKSNVKIRRSYLITDAIGSGE